MRRTYHSATILIVCDSKRLLLQSILFDRRRESLLLQEQSVALFTKTVFAEIDYEFADWPTEDAEGVVVLSLIYRGWLSSLLISLDTLDRRFLDDMGLSKVNLDLECHLLVRIAF